MGRKIPGRKHHGVRDPMKQLYEREKSLKHKINAPPTNPDDQPIPKSLQRLAELQEKAKTIKIRRKKPKKSLHEFERLPGEPDRQYMYRINQICGVIKHEAAFEEKFRVEIVKNQVGEIQDVKKRAKDPVEIMIKEAKKSKKKKKSEVTLTKSQKRQLKLKEKKKKKQEQNTDRFEKYDTVKFGEQVHAPPTLTTPRKVKSTNSASRPGQKDLLLKSILIDKKGKRKDLPVALRRQLDKQQEEVIKAYKLIKSKNFSNK